MIPDPDEILQRVDRLELAVDEIIVSQLVESRKRIEELEKTMEVLILFLNGGG